MTKLVMSADDFTPLTGWGSPLEKEVRRRISISVAAFAYEIADSPIMSDHMFDWCASRIDRFMGTCHPLLDEFFATSFSAMTGMWIHDHPELSKIEAIYANYRLKVIDGRAWEKRFS